MTIYVSPQKTPTPPWDNYVDHLKSEDQNQSTRNFIHCSKSSFRKLEWAFSSPSYSLGFPREDRVQCKISAVLSASWPLKFERFRKYVRLRVAVRDSRCSPKAFHPLSGNPWTVQQRLLL
eukprot:c23133_g1_i4 orf=243-602(+)